MLRRRIFSSAMASVMALSSIAVVANAEETAVANAKTKADLEAYVKSFDAFRASDIYEYGSISGEDFLNAVEYADNVLADDAASVQDYTVAYDMIEAIYNRLKIYSAEELKVLLDSCKGAYERGNILNEDLNDEEYNNNEGQYDDFAGAYADAEGVLDSSDSRLITDAYETLENAYKKLSRKDIVTKAQFRTALKSYETMLGKEFNHEAWRRGTISSDWNSEVKDWWKYSGMTVTYGGLYDLVEAWSDNIYTQYEVMDQIKTLNKTSDDNIVSAYKDARDALTIVSSWKADDTDRAAKANVTKLLEKYHNVLVYDYDAEAGEELVTAFVDSGVAFELIDAKCGSWDVGESTFEVADESTGDDDKIMITKTTSAAIKIKALDKNIFIPVTKDGYWDSTRNIIDDASKKNGLYKTINKNKTVDVAQYVRLEDGVVKATAAAAATVSATTVEPNTQTVNSDDNGVIDGGSAGEYKSGWGAYVAANTAYQVDLEIGAALAQFYLSADKDAIKAQVDGSGYTVYDIDTNDIIGEGKAYGSSLEWTLVHRYLKYALADKYDAPEAAKYKKSDVVALIDLAYELCEKTGDAALFEVSHNDLAVARKDAVEWLKKANKDKMYKDYEGGTDYVSSTSQYETLKGYYDTLEKEYNAFKYSFGEIAEKIYLYEDMIDAGELEATEALVAAIEETAYRLSVVETLVDANDNDLDENDAFSADRFFQGYNRVFTNGGDFDSLATADGKVKIAVAFKDGNYGPNASHYDLQVAFEAMEAEVKAQTEVTVLKGDVNGDGVVNAFDASQILKNIVNSVSMDVAVADYDGSGVVNALDASAILKAIVNA